MKYRDLQGIVIAASILLLWGISLAMLLRTDVSTMPLLIPAGILVQTFLYTGLFITAHDAMHGTIAPSLRWVNVYVGRVCAFLFALFSFTALQAKHWEHHGAPASEHDPDFHDGAHPQFWAWYLHFMREYLSWKQLVGMAIVFNILHHGAGVGIVNLLCFWVVPSLASTVQLFYFGTYLPHRAQQSNYRDRHRARSNDYPVWLSFLTCYHFGYHWEHHEFPHLPWWKLPSARRDVGK
jgi:beta-carotene ketolase (CrtW type)